MRALILTLALMFVGTCAYAQWDTPRPALDSTTGAAVGIGYEHHEIHAGDHFTAMFDTTLASGDTLFVLLTTPNTTRWMHFLMSATGTAITCVLMYEAPTATATGATLPSFNNNRNSANTSVLTLNKDAVATAYGTLIYRNKFGTATGPGSNTKVGGDSRESNEWILKQNTKYLYVVTSSTADNICAVKFSWYSHTNR